MTHDISGDKASEEDRENEDFLDETYDCITRHTFEMKAIITFIKMSNYEFRLYSILLEIANSMSLFSMTIEDLAIRMQCDVIHVRLAKKLLSQPRDDLGGMSLISINKRFCSNGKRINDRVTINNIRKLNIDLMDKRLEMITHK